MHMHHQPLIAALSLILAAGIVPAARGNETITRKHDKPVSGEVTGATKTEVTVKVTTPKEATVKVPANEIVNIAWTGEPPECNVARSDENGGKYTRAIDGYQKALQSTKSTNPLAKTDLEYCIARASAKLALADPAKADDAIKKLEDFRKQQADHYRFFDALNYLGQLYTVKNDLVKAKSAYEALGKAPWKEYQMASRVAAGRLFLSENKLDEAAAEYEAVVAMQPDGPLEESQRQEAVLGKARVMIAQKKFDESLKLLREVIDKAPAEDVKVNAEAFLRQGDCQREQGNDLDALLSYLLVDVMFASEKPLHAEALYRLVQLWEKKGEKGKADEARDRLRSDYENSEWTKQLKGAGG
jgi:tetratricopeptide (TPR) repeat protein